MGFKSWKVKKEIIIWVFQSFLLKMFSTLIKILKVLYDLRNFDLSKAPIMDTTLKQSYPQKFLMFFNSKIIFHSQIASWYLILMFVFEVYMILYLILIFRTYLTTHIL
jgi:hypothetical protein